MNLGARNVVDCASLVHSGYQSRHAVLFTPANYVRVVHLGRHST